jgi:hypothetical protein
VRSEDYATKIARDGNAPASTSGYVTRFRVRRDFLDRCQIHNAGGQDHEEYWIPAEDFSPFNGAIVGKLEKIIAGYRHEKGIATSGDADSKKASVEAPRLLETLAGGVRQSPRISLFLP